MWKYINRQLHPKLLPLGLFFIIFSLFISAKRAPRDKDRVYLIHADELRYDKWRNNDAQVLIGKVHFEHDGAHLYCDSANFFEQSNSFEAWGNVRMVQGDTLSLTSDYGYYDGNNKFMQAKVINDYSSSAAFGGDSQSPNSQSSNEKKVVLRNRTAKLFTDQLYFDRIENLGYYDTGGRLEDKSTTLTSIYGEYHTDTKDAYFNDDVKMVDKKFELTTDTLIYNTRTTLAHIVGPSDITSGQSRDTITPLPSRPSCWNARSWKTAVRRLLATASGTTVIPASAKPSTTWSTTTP